MPEDESADIAAIDEIISMVQGGADPTEIVAKLESLKQSEEGEMPGAAEPTAKDELMGIFKKAKEGQANE